MQGWIRLPMEEVNTLGLTDAAVLAVMLDRSETGGGDVEISANEIAAALKLSRSTVARSIARLKQDGYITKVVSGPPTIYTLIQVLEPKQRRRSAERPQRSQIDILRSFGYSYETPLPEQQEMEDLKDAK